MMMLQVSSNEETIDNLDKQLADSKITLSDSENKFDDISRKLVWLLILVQNLNNHNQPSNWEGSDIIRCP